jgi:hypothetical protein
VQAKYVALWLVLGMSNLAVMADETQQETPSLEMLEFLGQWETANGEWIDPASLEEMSLDKQKQTQGEQNEQ